MTTTEAMRIATTDQWRSWEACLQAKSILHAMPKNDRQKSKCERKAVLLRHGWTNETLKSRREQLRRHFCGRLYSIQGNLLKEKSDTTTTFLAFDCRLHHPTGAIDQVHTDG